MHIRGWKTRIPQLVLAAAILLIVWVAVPAVTDEASSGWPGQSSTGRSKTYTGSGPSPTILAHNSGKEDLAEVSIYDALGDAFGYDWRLGDVTATSHNLEIDHENTGERVVDYQLSSLDQNVAGSIEVQVGVEVDVKAEFHPEGDSAVTFDETPETFETHSEERTVSETSTDDTIPDANENQDPTDDSTPTD